MDAHRDGHDRPAGRPRPPVATGTAFSQHDYEELYQGQQALFRRGQAEGAFRDLDTRVMAITYQAAIDAMLSYLDSHPGTNVIQYADALTDILLASLARQPGG